MPTQDLWPPASANVDVPFDDELQIWRIDLGRQGDGTFMERILSEDERHRAARFHFDRDRQRYVSGRTALRRILALYGRCDAAAIEFEYSPLGKPSAPGIGVQFNVSHSGDVYVCAVRRSGRVGIDVERIRELSDVPSLIKLCLTPDERLTLRTLPAADWPVAFWNAWTRKEAYLKALGCGITVGLDKIDVTIAPESQPQLLRDRSVAHWSGTRWAFRQLPVGVGCLCVVAAEGLVEKVSLFGWPPLTNGVSFE